MRSELELSVADWLRRLADETGAFSIARVVTEPTRQGSAMWRPDVVAKLKLKDKASPVTLEIEAKKRLTPAEALATFERMEARRGKAVLVLCSPSISERVAEMCRKRGVSYLDEAGNCRIVAPGLFIQIEGRGNVRPDTRPTIDVFATKSSRIVRILLSNPKRGWQVQALAKEAQISLGLASKAKRALLERAFAEEREGLLFAREPEQLLRAWSNQYDVSKSKRIGLYALDSLPEVEKRIGEWCSGKGIRYALTQYSGAWRMAPMVRYNRSSVYVESSPRELIAALGSKPVNTGANLFLWTPYDPSVFYDLREVEGLSVVSPIQLYLDLIGEPGRGEEAAQEILQRQIRPTW